MSKSFPAIQARGSEQSGAPRSTKVSPMLLQLPMLPHAVNVNDELTSAGVRSFLRATRMS
jgi:hypothetical protein